MNFSAAVCVLSLACIAVIAADQPAAQPGQSAQHFEKQVPVAFDYLLFLPEGYDADAGKKWPLILFLHGAGERGSDLAKVKVHGPPKIVEKKKDFPFIVVSPQCPANEWWDPFKLTALLDGVMATYRVDPARVYLTGLSMGGFGTWELASRMPQRFAAIAPICGGGNPTIAAFRLRGLPVWVFHGDADPIVNVKLSDDMVEALKKAGNEVKYTRYEGVGHDSWTKSYDNDELYAWFLAHERKDAGGSTK
ncbi:MAG TPA: phospholipase [Planctomycetes bacterium]|nr:phospholipase [Planctomycetota bacterium]